MIYVDLSAMEFPGYRLGEDGSLWSKRHKNGRPSPYWRRMSIKPSGKGYRVATLVNSAGIRCMVAVRSLMLEAFVGPRPTQRHQACHNNGNPGDDRISNLRWDTPEGNQGDRLPHGTDNRGEKSGRNVHSEELVRAARDLMDLGESVRSVEALSGIPYPTLQQIKHRRNWRWL